jgi:ribosomal-protein-alanine N-acetyltransferase
VSPEPFLRSAGAADLQRIAEIEAAAFPDPWPASFIADEIANPISLVLVASLPPPTPPAPFAPSALSAPSAQSALSAPSAAAPPCAYACFRHAAGEAELLRVAVEPTARGRRLARTLILAGFARLTAAGVLSCHLEVRPENAPALAVYHGLGFTLTGRRRAYYRDGSDALVLRRDL